MATFGFVGDFFFGLDFFMVFWLGFSTLLLGFSV